MTSVSRSSSADDDWEVELRPAQQPVLDLVTPPQPATRHGMPGGGKAGLTQRIFHRGTIQHAAAIPAEDATR